MNRLQLAHVLRAACRIGGDRTVLVLGSQAILGAHDEISLPREATASMEADLAFLDDPDPTKADLVEGAIGELSGFHQLNGYYAEGIHIETAVLPRGWRERLVGWTLRASYPATPLFLEPHDLAVSKLIAARPKDRAFVTALIDHGLLDVDTLIERTLLVSDSEAIRRGRALAFLRG